MSRHILLADDEAYITSILATKLRKLGDEVIVACDGQQALELACAHRPQLVVSDFQMPVVSGFELAVKLKQNPQTCATPVLMLTGRGHLLSSEQLATTNIRHLLAKPFSAKALLAKIDELIGPPTATANGAQSE